MRDNPARAQALRARQLVSTITHDELPNPDDRAALETAIVAGDVEDVYAPLGRAWHNLTIPGLPAWVDPRIRAADWAVLRREANTGNNRDLSLIARIRAAMIAAAQVKGGQ